MTYNWNLLHRSRWLALTGIGFVALGGVTAANAQSPATIGTNVKGVSIIAPPPAGFNPLTASANERKMYGVPPEPDPVRAPKAHAMWQQSMAHFSDPRDTNVEVKQTNKFHRPGQQAANSATKQVANGMVTAEYYNWSGTAVFSSGTPFSAEAILGIFDVPTAHVALNSCTHSEVYSSEWVGVDGYNNSALFQAGVDADASCDNGVTSTFYSSWFEWIPNAETEVGTPLITPGDLLLVEVWNTSPTVALAYFHDISSGIIEEYQFDAPAGASVIGQSVEWIVERPEVGGSFSTLANYIDVPWLEGIAWNYEAAHPTYYYIGQNPPSNTLSLITMVEPTGCTSNCVGISFPTIIGIDFLWVADGGPAYNAQ
jgi:Peptidase A4 family